MKVTPFKKLVWYIALYIRTLRLGLALHSTLMARSCAFALIAGFIYKPARRMVESGGVGPPTVLFPLPLPFVSKPRPVGNLPRLSIGRGKTPAAPIWKRFVMASLVPTLLVNRDDLILLDFQPKCPSLVRNHYLYFQWHLCCNCYHHHSLSSLKHRIDKSFPC